MVQHQLSIVSRDEFQRRLAQFPGHDVVGWPGIENLYAGDGWLASVVWTPGREQRATYLWNEQCLAGTAD
jgi:hypothetical protein